MIEVFYLSAYSPELNSDEYLNCDLKAEARASAEIFKPGKYSLRCVVDVFRCRVKSSGFAHNHRFLSYIFNSFRCQAKIGKSNH